MLVISPKSNVFPIPSTAFEAEVIEFCQSWNAGNEWFNFHTSGSTGQPKAIRIHRKQMMHSAQLTGEWLGLEAGDGALLCLPVKFIGGVMVVVRALVWDLQLIIVEPSNQPEIPQEIPIRMTSLVPPQLQYILQQESLLAPFKGAKGVLVGGAAISVEIENLAQKQDFPIFLTYGMTETVSHIAYRPISLEADDFLHPLPGVEVKLNEDACICVRSQVTNHSWIETNDLAELNEDQRFRILGRKDFVINSGGMKLIPSQIEKYIQAYFLEKGISSLSFVAGIPDELYGQKAVLFIESSEQIDFGDHLKHYLLQHLSSKQIPKSIICLPKFLFNSNGKLDSLKTVALYLQSSSKESHAHDKF
ncbi:O-succinylbenzoic acid--CoA ligase [Cytophagaceae bacterium 50C-KIRBA]|uniref:O-succinylbenzoic acid--CoA ligase n=1 Tax=Aquirufa beregesia TaxID=2516556 RepID=A0ABX0ES80_9BACT|nr:AMP-binding protein [Aquirufa beregesia]NGZ43225.1 O-succinylbenzoic acid--CoA ligase [Aquirufa beregesia]